MVAWFCTASCRRSHFDLSRCAGFGARRHGNGRRCAIGDHLVVGDGLLGGADHLGELALGQARRLAERLQALAELGGRSDLLRHRERQGEGHFWRALRLGMKRLVSD